MRVEGVLDVGVQDFGVYGLGSRPTLLDRIVRNLWTPWSCIIHFSVSVKRRTLDFRNYHVEWVPAPYSVWFRLVYDLSNYCVCVGN